MATISKATVSSISSFGESVREFILKPEKYNFFDPGTFLQLSLDKQEGNRWPESRNFSIASYLNDDKTIRLIIRKIGVYTTRIFNELAVGSTCTIKYSFGDFLLPFYDDVNPIVCIAGGTGVAPFLSFVEYLKKEGQEDRIRLFYSAKRKSELIHPQLIKEYVNKDNLNIFLTREDSAIYQMGRIKFEDVIKKVTDIQNTHFYICGGEEFTKSFKVSLVEAGAENIYTDEW